MNTYNENLQNTVLASLQSQDLDQKNLKAQYNASKFTLYYSQGATITASENLASAQTDQTFKALVKEQATHTNNIATNLLSSATQAGQYLGQSVSNTAVCAANVQIAANAVTRLAGDVGGIFSFVNAADFDTDIYSLTSEVKGLVDDTAYLAELTSQIAMDASTLTSEVSAPTVLDNTKTTTAQMSSLLQIAGAAYDSSCQVVTADNATLASASAAEKSAEGTIECIGIDYNSSKAAYECINRALNLDLRVYLAVDLQSGTIATPESATTFTVTFECIQSPFPVEPLPKGYPVQNYYILVVKESKKLVFTLSDAESIVLNGANQQQFVTISAAGVAAAGSVSKTINYLKFRQKEKSKEDKEQTDQYEPMLDSDGDAIAAGENYVAFLLAVYLNEYKRKINDFDEYLSAPSQAFCLTDHLAPAQNVSVGSVPADTESQKDTQQYQQLFKTALGRTLRPGIRLVALHESSEKSSEFTHQLTFNVSEVIADVAYRCMLLPTADLEAGLLTANSFKTFFTLEAVLASVSNTYDPQIKNYQTQAAEIEMELQQVSEGGNMDALQKQLDDINKKIGELKNEEGKALETSIAIDKGGPGFMFDLTLAEQVSSGNYIPAVPYQPTASKSTKQASADKNQGYSKEYIAYIGPATTDNFGNMLVKGNKYLPVVLSVSTAAEDNLSQYTNAISDINNAAPFEY